NFTPLNPLLPQRLWLGAAADVNDQAGVSRLSSHSNARHYASAVVKALNELERRASAQCAAHLHPRSDRKGKFLGIDNPLAPAQQNYVAVGRECQCIVLCA